MADGEKAKPMSEQEKACFDILEDVDHVGSHVNGSINQQTLYAKWNLVAFVLQTCTIMVHYIIPSWQQASYMPLLADKNSAFNPVIKMDNERLRLISENPVAGAHFFHFMIIVFMNMFLVYGTSLDKGLVEGKAYLEKHMLTMEW